MFINNLNPVAFQIFSFEIRWYSLAYIFGILIGWLYCKKKLINDDKLNGLFDDLLSYLILGIIIGGRIGYVLFYNPKYYLENFSEIFMIWSGGMSFHGGLLGVIITTLLFGKKYKINPYIFLDLISQVAPIGLFLGRIANFINSELYGIETDVLWSVKFVMIDIFSSCGTVTGVSIGAESFEIPLNAKTEPITAIAIATPATIAIDEFLFIDNQPG